MHKFLKLILFVFISMAFVGCGKGLMNGDIQKNLEKSDKIYGKCNNPNRQFTKIQKKICEDKVRAAGPDGVVGDPINLTEIIKNFNNPNRVVYSNTAVNQELWNGSLNVLSSYSLKTVDSQGGFISTDWILKESVPNQRCMIKINITSMELISTGINTNILCETKINNEWFLSEEKFIEEEKQITLKILELAKQISLSQNQS